MVPLPDLSGRDAPALPSVTVVVPTRNRAGFLPDALRSLAAQQVACELEVVVVDNGSTDDTPDLLADWCSSDARFRWIGEEQTGQSYARNAGAAAAKGDLLLFTDDDVVVDPGWVGAFARFFAGRMDELVLAGGPILPIPIDLGSWPGWFPRDADADVGLLDHGDAERPLRVGEWLWGASMAIPAWAFARIGGWDTSLGHLGERRATFADSEIQERLRAEGGAVWYCPGAVLHHRVDPFRTEPRYVLRAAYCRSRDGYWAERPLGAGGPAGAAPQPLLPLLGRLGAQLARLVVSTAAFRLRGHPRSFAAAHRAARSAGRSVAIVDARERLPLRRVVRAATARAALSGFALAGARGPAPNPRS